MRWLLRLLSGWVLFRLFAPEWVPSFSPGQRHPHRFPGRSVFVGDREMFVRELGPPDAEPLVLVHGWGDHSLVVFGKLMPLLAERFRVIAIDNRNEGKSDRVRGDYEVASLADDVVGVLDQLGVSRASIMGYSMGGMAAQALAQRHPHRVTRLILAGTAAAAPGADQPLGALAVVVGGLARALDRLSRTETSWLRTRYLLMVGAIDPDHALWHYTEHRNRDADTYWAALGAINRFDARQWVGRLAAPTMVIIMCRDQLMPASFQYDLASRLRNPVVVELSDARHEGPLTHAERMAAAITDFMVAAVSTR